MWIAVIGQQSPMHEHGSASLQRVPLRRDGSFRQDTSMPSVPLRTAGTTHALPSSFSPTAAPANAPRRRQSYYPMTQLRLRSSPTSGHPASHMPTAVHGPFINLLAHASHAPGPRAAPSQKPYRRDCASAAGHTHTDMGPRYYPPAFPQTLALRKPSPRGCRLIVRRRAPPRRGTLRGQFSPQTGDAKNLGKPRGGEACNIKLTDSKGGRISFPTMGQV